MSQKLHEQRTFTAKRTKDLAPDLDILETKGFCTHQPQTKVCIRDHCLLSMLDFNQDLTFTIVFEFRSLLVQVIVEGQQFGKMKMIKELM